MTPSIEFSWKLQKVIAWQEFKIAFQITWPWNWTQKPSVNPENFPSPNISGFPFSKLYCLYRINNIILDNRFNNFGLSKSSFPDCRVTRVLWESENFELRFFQKFKWTWNLKISLIPADNYDEMFWHVLSEIMSWSL